MEKAYVDLKTKKLMLLGKELQTVMTATLNNVWEEAGVDGQKVITATLYALNQKPVDMLVFTPKGEATEIRAAGYDWETNELDETTILLTTKLPIPEKVWFKIDDYEKFFAGTFMLPSDY